MNFLNTCILISCMFVVTNNATISNHNFINFLEKITQRYEFYKNNSVSPHVLEEITNKKSSRSVNVSNVDYLGFVRKLWTAAEIKCFEDIKYMIQHLNSNWSIQMLDAIGKMPSGALLGNFLWMGKYQECVDVQMPRSNNDLNGGIHGTYCVAIWNITTPTTFHVPLHNIPIKTGVCLPSSCSALSVDENIQHLIDIFRRVPVLKQFESFLNLSSLKCKEEETFSNPSTSTFLIFLCLYLSLVIAGSFITIAEYGQFSVLKLSFLKFSKKNPNLNNLLGSWNSEVTNIVNESEECEYDQHLNLVDLEERRKSCFYTTKIQKFCEIMAKVLKCFCLFTNSEKVLDVKGSTKHFSCIHGIRFISMAWVVLGHTYIHNISIFGNYVDLLHGIDNLPFQVIVQGTFSVDTFFLISGFLLAYIYFEEADSKNGDISWIGIIIHRLIRITPVYAVLIAFNVTMFKYIGKGPFWEEDSDVDICRENWWWNLLYINNFLPLESMCVTWTWYLADDMQFFVVGTFLLSILWRWRRTGLLICSLLLLSSWILTWYISYYYNLVPLFWGLSQSTDFKEYKNRLYLAWDVLYSKPYCRIGPYLIGILLAYVLFKNKNAKNISGRWIGIVGWTASSLCCISVIYGVYHIQPEPYLFHFYNALSRSAFSGGVAWVIYTCLSGKAEIVNGILSFDLWVPLSRLTYCAYLFHPLIMSWYFESQKIPLYFTHTNMVMLYFAFLVVSYSAAFVISIIFEAPFINLEKYLRTRLSK
ncbi:nose resistant to fluoxetine protein 6 [Parasteatoda tepidariorum]|uniref:nose resistant to fluoxetine protein 6 n=1 Tax=Parasteatoda tepidariorum TaxID=114398 RepID=UPI001C721C32|nr:nose resistant to fluoxetine protein 6 [Parasteatoda tepidariorum]XP_015911603.2 nose resistant to fluoxetine protein 6 [Parasteatoda tepidariorum]